VRLGLDGLPMGIQWPERIAKHPRRVILMFDLNETWPVGTKARHRASRRFVTAKKSRIWSASVDRHQSA